MSSTDRTNRPRTHQQRDAAPADRTDAACDVRDARMARDARDPHMARDAQRHERRVGAAQLAAPSMRTWRRAGRFATS